MTEQLKYSIRILAIHPGTREMGVAVLERNALIYYAVKALRQGKIPHRVLNLGVRILERLMDEYEPEMIALEKTLYVGSRRSSVLHAFCKNTKAIAKERGINVFEYLPTVIREIICGDRNTTKRETAKTVANYYPELRKYLVEPKLYSERQKERYWMNLFDAAALAMACYRKDIEERDQYDLK